MKYYTFYPQFHEAIREGVKHSTIRGKAKVKPGERFALRYWTEKPYRSKMAFIGTAVCMEVHPVTLSEPVRDGSTFIEVKLPNEFWEGNYRPQFSYEFAEMEGFQSMEGLFDHFREKNSLPFSGVLTIWDPDTFIPGPPPTANSQQPTAHRPEAPGV